MKKFSLIFLMLFSALLFSQQKPAYWDDVQQFKQLDQQNPPKKGAILFLGSSSFTKWTDVADYFPTKTIINRAFGGSTLADLNYYADDLLQPYQPKQIVIYCGENDFAQNENLMPKEAFSRFKTFYKKIRKFYPTIPVDYVSIKMSPSRKQLWGKFKITNSLIKSFMNRQKNAAYIDITKVMQDSEGNVRSDLFLDDMLHMKPEGYQIWAKKMTPYLK